MADAQYVISIAAALEGSADLGVAQLGELEAALGSAGARSDDYAAAIAKLESQLDVARSASVAASAALGEGADKYSQLEREAVRAARAVELAASKGPELASDLARAEMSLAEYSATLGRLGSENWTEVEAERMRMLELNVRRASRAIERNAAVQPQLAERALEASKALEMYGGEVARLESSAAGASASQKMLERQLSRVKAAATGADRANAKANQRLEKLNQAAGLLPGPLGRIARQSVNAAKANQGLTAAFGTQSAATLVTVGVIAVATIAVAALTAAVVAGYVAFGKYSIATADAARSAALTRDAVAALDDSTAAAVGSFDAVTEATGLGDAQLIDLTKSLRSAKVAAADMPRALRAAAAAEAALGKGGSAEFIKRLEDGTQTVDGFASEVNAKFGGIVSKRLLGLDALSAKFSRNWSKLFAGLDIEPVLRALDTLVGMFDQANPLAQFFSAVIGKAFGPIAENAESAAVAIEAFALKVAIGLTQAYIFVKENAGLIEAALGLSAAAIGALFLGLPGLLLAGVAGLVIYKDQIFQIGTDLMRGLADGIVAGVTWVTDAISGAVSGAITSAKELLGIASPSKVFAEIGGYTAEGFADGVDAGAANAAASLAELTDPAPATPAAPGPGGGSSIDLSGATFVFNGVADAESATVRFGELLTRLIEGDADSIAGAEVPT